MPVETYDPPPALYTGDNHSRALLFIVIAFAVVAWFFGVYVYGWIFQPYATLANDEPLRTQVDFALIPVLPDDLAVEYDEIRLEQIGQLDGGEVNEEGNATIAIDAAIDRALELGFAVESDEAVAQDGEEEETTEEETSGD